MTRKNPPMRWTLPLELNPSGRVCFQIFVPDDPYYIAAFRGALMNLSSGSNWKDDPTHMAREVALVWRDICDSLDPGCGETNFTIACDYDFTTGVNGFAAVVVGGVTYSHYNGSAWEASCDHCNGADYFQNQIFKNILSSVLFSASVQYTSGSGLNFVMVNNVDSTASIHGPAGDHQLLTVAGPLPTSVIRPILTSDGGGSAATNQIERISVTLSYPIDVCP